MLEIRNISYSRGLLTLFSNLSFSVKEGEMIVVKGKNGSGKTTLLRILAGLIRSEEKTLFWQENEINSHSLGSYQQHLLYVGHKLCLYPEVFVKDQVRLWRDLYRTSHQVSEEVLHLWGLHSFKHKKISHLSQGQQKRLSLTRCSWLERQVWLLDEPHTGLDQEGRTLLTQRMESHLTNGGMVILATHEEVSCHKEIYL